MRTLLLVTVAVALLGCGASAAPPAAPPTAHPSPVSPERRASPAAAQGTQEAREVPSAWLELGGARMLVTTTRAARDLGDAALPLLVVLPWARSTPAELLAEVGYVEIDAPARIVALEGFERDGAGFSWWRRARPAPEPADPDRDAELVELLGARAARLAVLFGEIQRHFGSAAPPVVSGVSQGGDLSFMLAVHHSSSIGAALPIGSRFPAPLWPKGAAKASEADGERPPIDAFQGGEDPVAPFIALERGVAALRRSGRPAELHVYPEAKHEITPALRAGVLACAALRLRDSRQPCATAGR